MWLDDLTVKAYVTTSGDYVSLGTRTEYPFTSGGTYGVPLGWTPFDDAGTTPDQVNRSVGLGRFNISNVSTTDPHTNWKWGAYRDFPVTVGKRYLFQVQARSMDGKSLQGAARYVSYRLLPSTSQPGAFGMALADWEQFSFPMGTILAGTTAIRLQLQSIATDDSRGIPPDANWGIQFQNVAIIEQEATYPEPTWEEISCDIRNLQTRFGRDKFLNRYDVATCSISVLNNAGKFTYKPNGTLRPGRFIKLVVVEKSNGTEHPYYYGLIDNMNDAYGLDGNAYSVINCIDVSSLLSNGTVPTADFDSTRYLSGARFQRLLNAAGWKSQSYQLVDPGVYIQQPVLANGRTVRDELGLIADSEGGYFYCDRQGQLVYHDRNWDDSEIINVNAELLAMCPDPPPDPIYGFKFQFPKVDGNNLSLPSTYQLPTGDIDVRVRVMHDAMDFVGSSGAQTYVSRQGTLSLYRQYSRITLEWAGYSRNNPSDIPYGNNQPHWIRATRKQSNGEFHFYYAPDSDTEPTTWVDAGVAGTGVAWVAPTHVALPLYVGQGYSASTRRPFGGRFFRLIIRNGIGGAIWLDMSDDNVNAAGQTSFLGTTGQTWTVTQVAPAVIVQDDIYYPPGTGMPPVDSIPDLPDIPVIEIRELQPEWSRDRVVNDLSLANQGGGAFTTVNPESQKKYGPRSYQRLDFLNDNSHTEYLAERSQDYMDGYTEAILRVNTVQFRPNKDSYKFALDVFLNYLVRVRYQHPAGGWGFAVVSHVQGVEHSHSLTDWVVTLNLDNPEEFTYWETPDPVGTGWDLGGWDDDIWDGAADPNTYAYWDAKYPWSSSVSKWGN